VILGGIVVILLAPLLLGLGIVLLRRADWARKAMTRVTRIHPAPTAWDFAFMREAPLFVRVKLQEGERIGGVFGSGSFASAYPESQDLFLEQVWRLDDEGVFVEAEPDSRGILISRDQIETLELLGARHGGEAADGQVGER
jgi:hypothetical protein